MSGCNLSEFNNGNIGHALEEEDCSSTNKRNSLFERNLYKVRGLRCSTVFVCALRLKSYLSFKSLPIVISLFHFIIYDSAFRFKKLLNDKRTDIAKSNIEHSGLLSNKPFSQLFISAICKSADKMRYIVVLLKLCSFLWTYYESCFVFCYDCYSVLLCQ